ncbi:TPA: hypothetical protein ACH2H8_005358, partial [Klebsiella pneumoniae]
DVQMTPVCSAGNVKTECAARRKRHRRRGRLIHITDDSYINSRMLDQISDDVMYQEAFRKGT